MGSDFHGTEREQHLRFPGRIGGGLQIFAKSVLRFVELLLLGGSVAEIEPEIRFDSGIVDLSEDAEIFLSRGIIFQRQICPGKIDLGRWKIGIDLDRPFAGLD